MGFSSARVMQFESNHINIYKYIQILHFHSSYSSIEFLDFVNLWSECMWAHVSLFAFPFARIHVFSMHIIMSSLSHFVGSRCLNYFWKHLFMNNSWNDRQYCICLSTQFYRFMSIMYWECVITISPSVSPVFVFNFILLTQSEQEKRR